MHYRRFSFCLSQCWSVCRGRVFCRESIHYLSPTLVFLSDGLHVFSCNYFTCCRRPLSSFSYPLGCKCSLFLHLSILLLITTLTSVRSSLPGCRCSLSTSPHVRWLSVTTLYLCTCPSAFNYDSQLCAFLFVGLQVFALYLYTCPLFVFITTLTSVRFLFWFAGVRSLPLHLSIGFFNDDSHLCAFLFAGLQVFALYLSTYITIAISLDRCVAILDPMRRQGATQRVRIMMILAWGCSALFSIPQVSECRSSGRRVFAPCW